MQKLGSQSDLARRAKIGPRKVSDVERGIRAGSKTYDALEPVLHFPPGSIEQYLRGAGPLPVAAKPAGQGDAAERPSGETPPYEWSAESRRKLIAMSMEEVLQLVEHTRLLRGDVEAERALIAIMRLREEAAAIGARGDAL